MHLMPTTDKNLRLGADGLTRQTRVFIDSLGGGFVVCVCVPQICWRGNSEKAVHALVLAHSLQHRSDGTQCNCRLLDKVEINKQRHERGDLPLKW